MRATFAANLKAMREVRGVTQTSLASALGVSRVSIGYYEKGERLPDIDTLNKLCDFLDVSSDYLLGRTSNPSANADDQSITNRLGLSGLSIDILEQVNSYTDELATILNILIEQEFANRTVWAATLEKYPSSFIKHREQVFGDIDKQISEELEKHPLHTETKKQAFVDAVKSQMVNEWAIKYYEPILTRLYHYLVENKSTTSEDRCYILPDGTITYDDPVKDQVKSGTWLEEDTKRRIPFNTRELIEYALTMDILDRIRILKNKRSGVLGKEFE